MAFAKNQTYVVVRDFSTYDGADNIIAFKRGAEYKTGEDRSLIDPITGEVYQIDNHVSSRPDWYFTKKGSFSSAPEVTQKEYVLELIKSNSGFNLEQLWELSQLEKSGPCATPLKKINDMSSTISLVTAHHKITMYDPDGNLVEGVGHNKRNCTFHYNSKVA